MKTLVTSNVLTNPESMNQAPYLSIYTWLNALFMVKKLVFRNKFFLFPNKDILSSQSLSRHSAYGRQKNASSNRVQTISGFADSIIHTFMFLLYSTVSVRRFSATHFSTPTHVQVWERAEILLIFAHFCMRLHTNSRTLTWVGTKMCSLTHSLLARYPNGKYFAIANGAFNLQPLFFRKV